MKLVRWSWLLLAAGTVVTLVAPGCLLVQPLDDVKAGSGDESDAGEVGDAGSSATPSGGRSGSGPTPSGGKGGSGPAPSGGRGGAPSGGKGGSGPVPTAGSPSGVDFSYFTGLWTITSGTITTDCGAGPTDMPAKVGGQDTFDVGTTSDLILDKGTQCEILVDVADLVAVARDGQSCDLSDGADTYHLDISSFSFIVDDDHQTATSYMTSTITVTSNGVDTTCDSNQELYYSR